MLPIPLMVHYSSTATVSSTTQSAETSPPREVQQPKTLQKKMKAELDLYLSVAVLDSESNPEL